MVVSILSPVLDLILADVAATPGLERCGLLFGGAKRIDAAQPTTNVASDPAQFFEIDPAVLLAAMRAERGGGPRVIGHYHSHPNGSAEPSARDLAASEPGKLWLIVADGAARLWLSEAGAFRELKLHIA